MFIRHFKNLNFIGLDPLIRTKIRLVFSLDERRMLYHVHMSYDGVKSRLPSVRKRLLISRTSNNNLVLLPYLLIMSKKKD